MHRPGPSAWINYPTKYKFVGYNIALDYSLNTIDRSTYSILDYLGDIGGFNNMLKLIGFALLYKLRLFNLDSLLQHTLFDEKKSSKDREHPPPTDLKSQIKDDF